ncbi:MAG: 16S rRNA (cytosine(1402)-N(4))-methyltransferase [Opitutales bacterium]|nr:16S rRNA (cytosine(1402)-N(4))-methyltransferase [Opitutales bacterium]
MRLVDVAHEFLSDHLTNGSVVIDATVGNAHDTQFLAQQVGINGRVYGFDIQSMAIETATMILQTKKLFNRCTLIQAGHEKMDFHIPSSEKEKISAVMFNLGYLPHGDKSITTLASTTRQALNLSLEYLKIGGFLSVLAYRGHPGGTDEYETVDEWIRSKKEELQIKKTQDSNHRAGAGPFLWILQKK